MQANWANALDACAAAGIIDFDAPAFITGRTPRYVGHPDIGQLPLHNDFLLPPGVKLKDVPSSDTFNNSDGKLVNNPFWKKLLFAGVALAGILFGGAAISKFTKIKTPKISMPKFSSGFSKITNIIKKPFIWIASKIKK